MTNDPFKICTFCFLFLNIKSYRYIQVVNDLYINYKE